METKSSAFGPLDIKNQSFKRSAIGYSKEEVIQFLDKVASAWEGVQRQEKQLVGRIKDLEEKLKKWESKEGELEAMKERTVEAMDQLRKRAEQEAHQLFHEVEDRAQKVRDRTIQWLEKAIAEVEETERQKDNFLKAFRSALDGHYDLINREASAQPLGSRLNEFLKDQSS